MKSERMNPYTAPLDGEWIKSSYSTTNGDVCVQLMRIAGGVAVRDSKAPERGPLRYTRSEMAIFLRAVREGEFDHLLPE